MISPTNNTLSLAHDWLSDNQIPSDSLEYSPAKDWIKVSLPVKKVERLLATRYSVFEHNGDGDKLVRAPKWSLPIHLHEHIDTIQPTNSFFRPGGQRTNYKIVVPMEKLAQQPTYTFPTNGSTPDNITVAAACNTSAVTPTCLRTLYGTINYTPQAPDKVSIGLTDFLGEANNRSDIGIFLEKFRPEAVSAADSFAVDVINGGDNQQTPDTPEQLDAGKDLEGNLDAETILGIDYPIPLTAFTTGGMPPFIPDLVTRRFCTCVFNDLADSSNSY